MVQTCLINAEMIDSDLSRADLRNSNLHRLDASALEPPLRANFTIKP